MKKLFLKRNLIGFIIKIVGLVVLVWGLFHGIIISTEFTQHNMGEWDMVGGFGLFSFLSIVFTNAIYGILIIGFGEVIDLLQKIHDQNEPETVPPALTRPVPLGSEQEIREF